jgi:nucleoside-diphosphate-sugar epimerase
LGKPVEPIAPVTDFSNLRVWVSGARGFLGTPLCRRLVESGASVTGTSRSDDPGLSGVFWIRGDMGDLEFVTETVRVLRPDVIFHLTSESVGTPVLGQVLPAVRNDLIPAINVLSAAAEIGCQRLVMTASLEEPQAAGDEATPSSPYAAAKWAGGGYARMYHRLFGTPVVLVRPYMTYGPGQKDHKLLPYVCLSLLKGAKPKLGSGTRKVDWIYVDDVIEGFLAAAQKPGIEGTTIDLGSGTLASIKEVVTKLAKIVGTGVEPCFDGSLDRPVESVRAADTAAALAKLGWRPTTSLERGLTATADWYRRRLEAPAS